MLDGLFVKCETLFAIFAGTIATAITVFAAAIWIITFLFVFWSVEAQFKFRFHT